MQKPGFFYMGEDSLWGEEGISSSHSEALSAQSLYTRGLGNHGCGSPACLLSSLQCCLAREVEKASPEQPSDRSRKVLEEELNTICIMRWLHTLCGRYLLAVH